MTTYDIFEVAVCLGAGGYFLCLNFAGNSYLLPKWKIKKRRVSESMNDKLEMVEKKDLIYWLIIVSINLVWILTCRFGNNSTVLNYFSFAATTVSIILAVIAIIYSFYVSAQSMTINDKLVFAADRIEGVTNILERTGLDISAASDNLSDIDSRIDELHELTMGLLNYVSDRFKNSEIMLSSLMQLSPVNHQEYQGTANIPWFKIFGYNDFTQSFLYFISRMEDMGHEIDLIHFSTAMAKDTDPENIWSYYGYFLCFLILMYNIGLISIDRNENIINTVSFIDTDMKANSQIYNENYHYIEEYIAKI